MPRFILALDQGTTSSRSILFDHAGNAVAMAQREFPQYFPQSGWVEHDAREIWASQSETIAGVLAKARASPTDIAAVGISNQRETVVLWDRHTGEPIARAIVWQDRRTAPECARLQAAGLEPEIARRTGLLIDPYFSGTKVAWLLDNHSGARSARGARRTVLRHDRQLARVAAVRRKIARHRCDQCQPHSAVQHSYGRVG